MSPGERPEAVGLTRSVRNGIFLWLVVVGAVSTLGWLVIARAGAAASLLGSEPAPRAMTAPAVPGATSGAAVTAATSPGPSTSPAATAPTPAPAPTGAGPAAPTRPSGAATGGTKPGAPSGGGQTPALKAVPGSTTTRGGSIGATCTGTTLALSWVTPNQGWSNTRKVDDNAIEVQFRSGDGEVEVKVRCSDGAPTFTVD